MVKQLHHQHAHLIGGALPQSSQRQLSASRSPSTHQHDIGVADVDGSAWR
jgi:hypothetical protein